ncbi:MAG: cache domain-containing protein, partial [Herminiimonas sp.]|nr:cache domain-containing protein [Herminiimonas sp.]
MKLRQKIILLAIIPLIAALCAIALAVRHQAVSLAQEERAAVESAYLATKQGELRHYVSLGTRSISNLYDAPWQDAETQEQAKAILEKLDYGDDGYFFIYDLKGINLMHPRQPELVGRNLWDLTDTAGNHTIQNLIARAEAGGGIERYLWVKPSTGKVVSKLGYVVLLKRWGWVLGTGLYMDDVEAALAKIDAQTSANIANTMWWIAAIAIAAVLVIGLSGLWLNLSEYRVADAKLKVLAQRVVHSQELERARLSRDLHDGISQLLVSVKL